jgi:hypothetical protein
MFLVIVDALIVLDIENTINVRKMIIIGRIFFMGDWGVRGGY